MKLVTGKGVAVGTIGQEVRDDRAQIYRDYLEASNQESSKADLSFIGKIDEKSDEIYSITLPRGTWDIMASLLPMILKYQPGDIVEIGMGESTEIFADIAYQMGLNLYSCDIKMGGMFEVFDKPLFENHHCFTEGSDVFMEEFGGSPSIVFIDGEHLYETTKKEVEFFLPKIRPGGVMFLHDTMPVFKKSIKRDAKGYNPGDIYKVRQELERDPRYDVFTWPYSAQNMGLTMVMVHGTERPHWRENGRVGENESNK